MLATQPITLRFQNAKLKEVFEILARAAGLNVLLDKEVKDEPITIFIKDTPFPQALNLILSTNGLFAKRIGPDTLPLYLCDGNMGNALAEGLPAGTRVAVNGNSGCGACHFCARGRPRCGGPSFSSGGAKRRKQSIAASERARLSTFFRSVIQATDSTSTGCTANSAAASHAPGTCNRANNRPAHRVRRPVRQLRVSSATRAGCAEGIQAAADGRLVGRIVPERQRT